jgi:hypothetical protein
MSPAGWVVAGYVRRLAEQSCGEQDFSACEPDGAVHGEVLKTCPAGESVARTALSGARRAGSVKNSSA